MGQNKGQPALATQGPWISSRGQRLPFIVGGGNQSNLLVRNRDDNTCRASSKGTQMQLSLAPCCDKTPDKSNLKSEGLALAHSSRVHSSSRWGKHCRRSVGQLLTSCPQPGSRDECWNSAHFPFLFSWDANPGVVAPLDRLGLPTSIFSLSSVYVCVDQRTNCGSLFSPSTMWVLGIKLRSLGLMAGVFIC